MVIYESIEVCYGASMAGRRRRGGRREGAGRKPEFEDRVLRSISFERAEMRQVEAIAERRGVSFSEVVRRAVTAYLKRQRRGS